MQTLWQDLRYGARMLLKRPGFTLIAVLTLSLGIGANTAIFGVVHALLLKPLPFPELERVVAIWDESQQSPHNEVAAANYLDWQAQSQSYERLAMYRWWSTNLTGIDEPERVQGFLVTANLIDALGLPPVMGRNFRPEENEPGKDNVVILTHGLWQRRFGGDPQIIGKTITLNGVARTVVGVTPAEFNFPRGAEVLAPLAFTPELKSNRGFHSYYVVGRLKAGVPIGQAQAELNAITARLAGQYPDSNTNLGARIYPLLADTVQPYSAALIALACAVAFVLLIACANVANLLLARAAGRTREIAIRAALGASRFSLIRQLMTESVLLAVIGGALGVLFAVWGVGLLKASLPALAFQFVPGLSKLGVNYAVLGFTLALSVLTGIVFGLAPALQTTKLDLNESLKEGSKGTAGTGHNRLRGALVVAEVALSLVLLAGAGLMMRSFLNLLQVNPGFNGENVLTMSLILPQAKYGETARRAAFFQELTRRVQSLPGIESAGFVSHLPLGGENASGSYLIEGAPEPPPDQRYNGRSRICTPDYFKTMGVTLLKGRFFTEQDRADSPPVVIVNETLATKFFPDGGAIGKRFRFTGQISPTNPWREIVGVIADVKHDLTTPIQPEYYRPHAQAPGGSMMLAARVKSEPLSLAAAIRGEVRAIDKDQPVSLVRTMEEVRKQSVLVHSLSLSLLGVFAVIALVLASVGIYGVMSYVVSQRSNEIGIRIALGARGPDVLKMVVGQGMRLTVIGLGIGMIAAAGLMRLAAGLLFGVGSGDWGTLGLVALLLALVSLLACLIPARRATKVDPMVALRVE